MLHSFENLYSSLPIATTTREKFVLIKIDYTSIVKRYEHRSSLCITPVESISKDLVI